MSSPTLEFPAGRVEAGEDLASALRREMLEELGFECERVTELGQLLTAPHFSDEVVHCFVVKGAVRSQVAPTPKEEILEGMKVASRDLLRMISTGQIMDGKTLSAIAMLVAEGLLP